VNKTGRDVREFGSKAEVNAMQFREGLLAFERNFDLQNVLSLSPLAQQTYWLLKEEEGQ
jgi:hypothetical protein